MRKNILNSFFVFFAILNFFPNDSLADSLFSLKIKSDAAYNQIKNCLKARKNDTALCVDEFKDYIRAEIKHINAGAKQEFKDRLKKAIDTLQKATDIYYQKGVERKWMI